MNMFLWSEVGYRRLDLVGGQPLRPPALWLCEWLRSVSIVPILSPVHYSKAFRKFVHGFFYVNSHHRYLLNRFSGFPAYVSLNGMVIL